jgi:hypothetical protein
VNRLVGTIDYRFADLFAFSVGAREISEIFSRKLGIKSGDESRSLANPAV